MADACAAVVIGIGNELRGDDAAGRHVAAEVERRALAGVSVVSAIQLVPEMIESIETADLAVFVDAAIDTDRVVVRALPTVSTVEESHHATPTGLVALVDRLGAACPPAFLVEVPAAEFDVGADLSPEARHALPCAVDAVVALITTCGDGSTSPSLDGRCSPEPSRAR